MRDPGDSPGMVGKRVVGVDERRPIPVNPLAVKHRVWHADCPGMVGGRPKSMRGSDQKAWEVLSTIKAQQGQHKVKKHSSSRCVQLSKKQTNIAAIPGQLMNALKEADPQLSQLRQNIRDRLQNHTSKVLQETSLDEETLVSIRVAVKAAIEDIEQASIPGHSNFQEASRKAKADAAKSRALTGLSDKLRPLTQINSDLSKWLKPFGWTGNRLKEGESNLKGLLEKLEEVLTLEELEEEFHSKDDGISSDDFRKVAWEELMALTLTVQLAPLRKELERTYTEWHKKENTFRKKGEHARFEKYLEQQEDDILRRREKVVAVKEATGEWLDWIMERKARKFWPTSCFFRDMNNRAQQRLSQRKLSAQKNGVRPDKKTKEPAFSAF